MSLIATLLLLVPLLTLVASSPRPVVVPAPPLVGATKDGRRVKLAIRDAALQNSPTNGYAPKAVACPASPAVTIRQPSPTGPANSAETSYVASKSAKDVAAWQAYLSSSGSGIDSTAFFAKAKSSGAKAGSTLPNVAFAVSGGGLRALLNGAGVLNGFDGRNAQANSAKTGGLLQLANYMSGLSGGSWMLASWATSNYPTFPALNQTVWDLSENIALPRANSPQEYAASAADVLAKRAAGYEISLIDLYGRILSYHFVNDTKLHGAATLYDSIRNTSNYQNTSAPFPIIVSTSRNQGSSQILLTNPIYESTPLEFGTNDPTINAFISIDYMGTAATAGKPSGNCTVGFGNTGFIFGASSDIFGDAGQTLVSQFGANPALTAVTSLIPDQYADDAVVPNSFKGLGTAYTQTGQTDLFLADGGLANENVPFWPVIQPSRALDVVIALDASADANNYPNGTAPYTTHLKTQMKPAYQPWAQSMPPIPQAYPGNDFTAKGYNQRPTFFGCNATTSSSSSTTQTTPLIVYLPNYHATYATNTSTFQLQYTSAEVNGFFDNGFAIATQKSNATWAACLACAVADRQNTRNGQARTAQCQACFNTYCA